MARTFFIDSMVLLDVAQPQRGFLHTASVQFLEANRDELCVGTIVVREVAYQLREFPERYEGARRVKQWLYSECEWLSDHEPPVVDHIEALQAAYAAQGWHGQRGDNNDRIHLATAAVFDIPNLITWENRIAQQQPWVNEVNRERGYARVRIERPDTFLTH